LKKIVLKFDVPSNKEIGHYKLIINEKRIASSGRLKPKKTECSAEATFVFFRPLAEDFEDF